ncbi:MULTISPECIES: 3-hexulose-6-phosphate synthase [Bacillus]|uniref:3-hexulose-6-phosphate synthase n=2 Tax=Bacillus TaxID=1386 RepID=A0A0M3RAD5_9BACI|nr:MULTISPECIES: 3-hexulose-6-phosphate synthase [Bacillus]ALC82986.1 3-hexulose-6-phosphate synthase [Bacillus gobiensis]MBP1081998.1 3-hexulose-6-phosphate synthase [Bacillus capparidis]MED1096633.1 orotidine 5'-phosphate decarboxylase [Bacillus capparidis]
MKIQLALDRLTISDAIRLTEQVRDYVDWIEVGTSLIKEFGVASIKAMKEAFPEKVIVADCKTIDNAKYEFEMCYEAGADIATVMGVSPAATLQTCEATAKKYEKQMMIDLLNVSEERKKSLLIYQNAIFCDHVSKDEQEIQGLKNESNGSQSTLKSSGVRWTVAGGITFDPIERLKKLNPTAVIIGSAITKADQPSAAAARFRELIGGTPYGNVR